MSRPEVIRELQAVPTKYFPMFTQSAGADRNGRLPAPALPSRADTLIVLRDQILSELQQDVRESPPGLSKRYLKWYPDAVVPLLVALCSQRPSRRMVNVLEPGSGLVREGHAFVRQGSVPFRNDVTDARVDTRLDQTDLKHMKRRYLPDCVPAQRKSGHRPSACWIPR